MFIKKPFISFLNRLTIGSILTWCQGEIITPKSFLRWQLHPRYEHQKKGKEILLNCHKQHSFLEAIINFAYYLHKNLNTKLTKKAIFGTLVETVQRPGFSTNDDTPPDVTLANLGSNVGRKIISPCWATSVGESGVSVMSPRIGLSFRLT